MPTDEPNLLRMSNQYALYKTQNNLESNIEGTPFLSKDEIPSRQINLHCRTVILNGQSTFPTAHF